MRALFITLALAACSTQDPLAIDATTNVASIDGNEDRYWATQAALLDPLAYELLSSTSPWYPIDATVPEGETWYAVQSFAVYFNTPTVASQDLYPLSRRSGFLRSLDSRRSFTLPEGTRIRSIPDVSDSYIHVAIPSRVWATDERYETNPRGLYFSRLAALDTLAVKELIVESIGGGAIDDVVRVAIPSDFALGMLIASSVYDSSWATFGRFNLHDEINNSHTVRFANTMLFPFKRDAIGGDYLTLCKGSTSDGAGVWPVVNGSITVQSSKDPAHAYPIKGTANVLYQVLPEGW